MKNRQAQALGKLGGLARAKALTSEQRLAISAKANEAKRKRALIRKGLSYETDGETAHALTGSLRGRAEEEF